MTDDEYSDDYVPCTPEGRLKEWAIERQHQARSYLPRESVEYRLMHEGAGASQSTASQSDGGMLARMVRMGKYIQMENRAKEVEAAYQAMPGIYRAIVDAQYLHVDRVHAQDIVRSFKGAASLCGLKEHEFRPLRERMLGWLAARLDLPVLDERCARVAE